MKISDVKNARWDVCPMEAYTTTLNCSHNDQYYDGGF